MTFRAHCSTFFFALPAAVLALLCVDPSARAAELYLVNGDRISGDLLRRENGMIYFKSAYLGEIAVPERDAVVVDTPQTPVESLAGLPPGGGPLPADQSVSQGKQTAQPRWRGTIEFGYQQQQGREDAVDLTTRANAERTAGPNNYRGDARLLYGEREDLVDSNRLDASFRWRRELSTRTFSQSLTSYTQDRIKQIKHSVEQSLGAGYRVFDTPRHSTNIGLGLTTQYREAFGLADETSYLAELFQDYTYRLTGRITFFQDARVLYSPDERETVAEQGLAVRNGVENYRVRFNSALQGKLTERISINLRFEYEFDNSVADPDARSDKRISSSVGYGF